MKYTVVSSAEFCYPDRFIYPSSASRARVFGARGGYASFQILLDGVTEEALPVTAEGFSGEIYVLYPTFIEKNIEWEGGHSGPHMPERKAPYYVYDALMPYRGKVKLTDGRAGLYIAIPIAPDAVPGVEEGALHIGDLSVPVTLEVMKAVVPGETLTIVQGYQKNFAQYHGAAPDSPDFSRLNDEYMRLLRRMHQNMVYTKGIKVKKSEDGQYSFDFSGLEACIREAMGYGITSFILPHLGRRKSWKESTIYVHDMPAMSYEAYCFLSRYLPALRDFLTERGWMDRCLLGISDEPNPANWTEYRALCGLVRKIAPEFRLMDAMSYGDLHGALDVWIPLNSEYDLHRREMETLRGNGDEIWFYVCCVPRTAPYINRFTDYALLCTRMLFWGSYRYNLTGYLHWAVNFYQNGVSRDGTEYHQDPFLCACPEHHNADSVCFLPAGDTHLLYPGGFNGNGEIQEPWLSIRAENQRESAEEYELLRALAQKDKALADRICQKVFRSFGDIEFDVNAFEAVRHELMEACGEL